MQKPFLVKRHGDKYPRLAELSRVTYRHVMKRVGSIDAGMFGNIPHMKETNRLDKSMIELWMDVMTVVVRTTKDGVHSKIRRIRPDEAALLDNIDAQMEKLHTLRKEVLKHAWERGHVVTVKELIERAEQETKGTQS